MVLRGSATRPNIQGQVRRRRTTCLGQTVCPRPPVAVEMKKIDLQLANLQTEVELHGRSGFDSIYLRDVQITFPGNQFELPQNMRESEVSADLNWFLQCADVGTNIKHPDPYNSFWLMQFGEDAKPYGANWDLPLLFERLEDMEQGRRCLLCNCSAGEDPCVSTYQFHREHDIVHLTVNMRSSDVVGILPFDVSLSRALLKHVCTTLHRTIGNLTFNLGNAHVRWEDCIHGIDEFTHDSESS